MEDPNYGNLTLNNLLKIAAALDVGLLVKLVPFSRLVREFEDLSPEAMSAPSFIEELSVLEAWAATTPAKSTADPGSMNPSLIMTYGSAGRYQQDNRPLKLPAPGEPFELDFTEQDVTELDFPRRSPMVARGDTRNTPLTARQPLLEAS
jgi:hypothetical protein